ncbi:LacI family transcriptional regulator [Nitriliruptoraceae bacterium ZYF776]|nr:LacI family transcriptional regulator [Profundirhabdus halotolerans]
MAGPREAGKHEEAGSDEPSSRATLEQVAALAGVSRSTVSRVVNAHPKVSPAARRAVEAAIAQLGYLPNPAARSLVTRRTRAVALVVREPDQRVFGEPFFAGIVRGISTAVGGHDLQLVLLLAGPDHDAQRLERYLFGGNIDGALLLSLHGDDPLPRHLLDRGVPTVMGGRPTTDDPRLSYVDVDNVGGAARATAHLLAAGRREVGHITGPLDMVAGRDRREGYRRAFAESGRPHVAELEVVGDFTREGGAAAMRELLRRRPDVDGVVASSDLAATGALQVLAEHGRRVPDDVAVTGFDDSLLAASAAPALTTVHQPVEAMGTEMVRLLVGELDGSRSRFAHRVVLPTELVVRDSA